jgi:hypothetical protein
MYPLPSGRAPQYDAVRIQDLMKYAGVPTNAAITVDNTVVAPTTFRIRRQAINVTILRRPARRAT